MRRPDTIAQLVVRLIRLRARPATRHALGAALACALVASCVAAALGARGAAARRASHGEPPPVVYAYAIAWNGAGYGLVYRTIDEAYQGLVFQRLGTGGQRLGEAVRLGVETHATPQLRWSGRDYALVWEVRERRRPPRSGIALVRLAPSGQPMGEPVRLAIGVDELNYGPRVAWTGREWGVAWHRRDDATGSSVHFARVSAEGRVVDPDAQVIAPCRVLTNLELAVEADGFALGRACVNDGGETATVRLARLDASGRVRAQLDVATSPRMGWHLALAVADGSDGLLWEVADQAPSPHLRQRLVFAAVRGASVVAPPRFVTEPGLRASDAGLLATREGFAALWSDNRATHFGAWFVRLAPDGAPRGDVVRMDSTPGEVESTTLVPAGDGQAAAWALRRGFDRGIYIARVGRDGRRVGDDVRVSP